jgi:saccharopepsin
LQLDTGSSDVWIKGTTSPLPNVEQTPTTYNLTYGIGWAFGHISFAPTEFAGISVPHQAFLDTSAAQNPALGFGAQGIIGLGFTSLSTIDALVSRTGASTGRSLLYNLFEADPSQPNFIAFALQRSTVPGAVGLGSFSVGEYVPQYAGVADTPAIPTFPPKSPTRWTVLMDSLIVQGRTVSVSSTITGVPFNKAVALLDSGTSYTYAPVEVCDAIYKNIPGARFDDTTSQWIVPCDIRIDMALQFNGRVFPIHPLDVTPQGIADPSTCVGSFIPQAIAIGAGQL